MGCHGRDGCSGGWDRCFHTTSYSFINQRPGWKGSPTPWGEGDSRSFLLGGFQSSAESLWCIWSGGMQTFVQDRMFLVLCACFCKTPVDRAALCAVCWDLLAFGEISVCGGLFFSASDRRGEQVESRLSVFRRALLPNRANQSAHKATLPHFTSGLTPRSVCLAEMISNLDDFSTLCMKMECYIPLSDLLPIYLT